MMLRVAISNELVILFQENLAKEYRGYGFPGGCAPSDTLVLSNSGSLVKTRAEEHWMLLLGSTSRVPAGSGGCSTHSTGWSCCPLPGYEAGSVDLASRK